MLYYSTIVLEITLFVKTLHITLCEYFIGDVKIMTSSQIVRSTLVEVSARHIHLALKDLEALFGPGYKPTVMKDLSQPGEFACEERVTIAGPKRSLDRVVVLGPTRAVTQIEVSATEAYSLGIPPIVRESGDLDGTPGCTLVGPYGKVELTQGVIVAKRHIHMTPADAEKYDLTNKQVVSVKIDSNGRSLIFGDVVVRVNPNYALAMHIDTDEANAALIDRPDFQGEIIV